MGLRKEAKKDVEGGSKTRGKFLRTAASVGPCYAFTDSPLMTFKDILTIIGGNFHF